ncbi:TolC family protein [Candidatus Kaistella beijingensis]|uniref:TolC family protein n=1 Tax=Candidatus Kaistella beijingensis TaxID=2820270 RepID=UPI001CC7A0E0|nr:TolC family protein [Candidatus Kaistella beijingensis]UBB89714.1 TolC family protein [Candidatus Kaistella beijingensis]
MKKFKYLFLLYCFSMNAQTLTLQQCYQLARGNYPLIKRNDLLAKSKDYTVENASKAWLPQINILGQATYQSDVTQLPIKLPNATVEPLSKDQYKFFADVNQTIFDGGMISNQKKIAELQSQTEIQKNEVELEKLKDRINQLFFGIIQTDEQINQLDLSKSDLQNGLKKAEAQLKYGTILRSNVDVLKAQLINIEQQQIELKSLKSNFIKMLSFFTNKNLDEDTQLEKPEKLLLTNENNRPELKLFDLQKQLSESQKSLIKSKNLPKLGAFLQAGYGKPGLNMLKNEFDTFFIGGIKLNIPISGFYTKSNELALIDNQQQDIDIQKENFLFNQKFSMIQNSNDLEKIQKLIDKDIEIISLRESIKKASLAQLENGVINTNDYLREVNAEEQAKISKIKHEIQYLLTQYNLKTQLGN